MTNASIPPNRQSLITKASSSNWQSNGLQIHGMQVRILPGLPNTFCRGHAHIELIIKKAIFNENKPFPAGASEEQTDISFLQI